MNAGALLLVAALWILVSPRRDAINFDELDDQGAEAMAKAELLRWSRLTDSQSTDQQIVGVACLLARDSGPEHKRFVFGFTRSDLVPAVRSVQVSSAPHALDVNVISAPGGDASLVAHCGRP